MSDPPEDMMIPIAPLPDGGCVGMRLKADEEGNRQVMVGEFLPIKEGRPILGDILQGAPIDGTPYLALTTEFEHPNPYRSKSGGKVFSIPSARFQKGWDRIFKNKPVPEDDPVVN